MNPTDTSELEKKILEIVHIKQSEGGEDHKVCELKVAKLMSLLTTALTEREIEARIDEHRLLVEKTRDLPRTAFSMHTELALPKNDPQGIVSYIQVEGINRYLALRQKELQSPSTHKESKE